MKIMIDQGGFMPERAHDTDAGLDLRSPVSTWVHPFEHCVIDTGVHVAIPAGCVGLITSKSGLMAKGITCRGTIDSGYTGSIKAVLYNHGAEGYGIHRYDKICQLVLLPIITPELEVVDTLDETERGGDFAIGGLSTRRLLYLRWFMRAAEGVGPYRGGRSMSNIKPILFNTEMVLATLENRKTQTRRVVSPTPPADARLVMGPDPDNLHGWDESRELPELGPNDRRVYYPRYYPGDILYVRETWAEWSGGYIFKADPMPAYPHSFVDRWRPSIFMPKEAARLFLRVTDVRVERLQEIDENGAKAEGIREYFIGMGESGFATEPHSSSFWPSAVGAFAALWNSTLKHMDHIRYGWAANPWVWVYCFERCEKPEDWA